MDPKYVLTAWVDATLHVLTTRARSKDVSVEAHEQARAVADAAAVAPDLVDFLLTGELLCLVCQAVHPALVPRPIRIAPSMFGALENLTTFAKACRALGIDASFHPRDAIQGRHAVPFLLTVFAFARTVAARHPPFPAPSATFSAIDLAMLVPTMHRIRPNRSSGQLSLSGPGTNPDFSALLTRMSVLEDQQQRLLDTVQAMQQHVVASHQYLEKLSTSMIDAFFEFQETMRHAQAGKSSVAPLPVSQPVSVPASPILSNKPVATSQETLVHPTSGDVPTESTTTTLYRPASAPAILPPHVAEACTTKVDRLRQSAIYELVATERDFVRDIGMLVAILASKGKEYDIVWDLNEFMGNLPTLLADHEKMLAMLEDALVNQPVVEEPGRLFLQMMPYLASHVDYATHYSHVMAPALQLARVGDFSAYLATLPETRGHTLDSLLIKPIQRITKYPLLVAETKKYAYENDPDYQALVQALAAMRDLTDQVDQSSKTNSVHQEKLALFSTMVAGFADLDLSPACQYLREGSVDRWCASANVAQPTYWILFSERLLVCKPGSSKSFRKKYEVLLDLVPSKVVVHAVASQQPGARFPWLLELIPVGKGSKGETDPLVFGFATEQELQAWTRGLEKAVALQLQKGVSSLMRRSKSNRSLSMSMKKPWARFMDYGKTNSSKATLPEPPVNPRSLPDNAELIGFTLDDHYPATSHDLGFQKHTFLRITHAERSDVLKVAMNRVVGLVPRHLVQIVKDMPPVRYARILAACQSDMALTWIEYAQCCIVNMTPTPLVAAASAAAAVGAARNAGGAGNLTSVTEKQDAVASRRASVVVATPLPPTVAAAPAAPAAPVAAPVASVLPRSDVSDIVDADLPRSDSHPTPATVAARHMRKTGANGRHAARKSDMSRGSTKASLEGAGAGDVVTEPVPSADGWFRVVKPGQRDYYFRRETGETRWEPPSPVVAVVEPGVEVTVLS
ncbi:Myosin 10A, isoform D [Allomyces arbusculus]|nr:Myosin 10A, isoform D [Allomyces arbusculus]